MAVIITLIVVVGTAAGVRAVAAFLFEAIEAPVAGDPRHQRLGLLWDTKLPNKMVKDESDQEWTTLPKVVVYLPLPPKKKKPRAVRGYETDVLANTIRDIKGGNELL